MRSMYGASGAEIQEIFVLYENYFANNLPQFAVGAPTCGSQVGQNLSSFGSSPASMGQTEWLQFGKKSVSIDQEVLGRMVLAEEDCGAGGRTRTGTGRSPRGFKPLASTNSATPAPGAVGPISGPEIDSLT